MPVQGANEVFCLKKLWYPISGGVQGQIGLYPWQPDLESVLVVGNLVWSKGVGMASMIPYWIL